MATFWDGKFFKRTDKAVFNKLTHDIKTDCVVIGGGITGILTANELSSRGFSTVVLEANTICSGGTGKTTAKITSQHGLIYARLLKYFGEKQAKMYFESQNKAIDYIEQLVQSKNIDCDFVRLPACVYCVEEAHQIIKEHKALNQLGIAHELTNKTDLPYPIKAAIRFENQAQFNPVKFVRAIASSLEIYENSPVVKIERDCVYTDCAKVCAHYIIVATGYPIINNPGFYFARQHQERSYVIAIKSPKKIREMYLGIDDNRSVRRYNDYVLIGGEKHRTGKNKGGCYCTLMDFAQRYFKSDCQIYSWSNQDCIAHDGVPFIGNYSKYSEHLFVATGFGKWGMTNSAVSAQLISDLICDRKNEYIQLYTPQRLNLPGSIKDLSIDLGQSVSGLFQGWILSGKSKRCSHMGCKLKENKEENTLECPCHGSQFDKDGNVLRNPAIKKMTRENPSAD